MGNSESHHQQTQQQRTQQRTRQRSVRQTQTRTPASRSRIEPNAGGGPGITRIQGAPQDRPRRFQVTIPQGVRPGDTFTVLVEGRSLSVRCPPSTRPGDRVIINAPAPDEQQSFIVTVPQGVRPGEQFPVRVENRQVMVTCPPGAGPGQRVTFQLPKEDSPPLTPNHQMFEVVVPSGVFPGQAFALIANGQRVMVTCPPGAGPGQKIRFQLPVQLSSDQLESFKLSYDKDGWMRCLDESLKFRWFYSSRKEEEGKEEELEEKKGQEEGEEGSSSSSSQSVERLAFVRDFVGPDKEDLVLVQAEDYALETHVPGTSLSFSEIMRVKQLPFSEKVEWIQKQCLSLKVPWEEGHMRMNVRRSMIAEDTVVCMAAVTPADLRKIWRFEFVGEPAIDAGGVAREFFTVSMESLCNPDLGLFLYSSVNQTNLQINPNSGIANQEHLDYFHAIGRLVGKALFESQLVPVHFTPNLYKQMLAWPLCFADLEQLDVETYNNLLKLTEMPREEIEDLYLDFTITEDRFGMTEDVELIPERGEEVVTGDTLDEFLEANLKYRIFEKTKVQQLHFLKGFHEVVPEPLLAVFDFQELELLLCGLPHVDIHDWMSNTLLMGEFERKPDHKVVRWFWEVVSGYSEENRARLLQFSTGTSGVPVQGFSHLQGLDNNIKLFSINGIPLSQSLFPRSHTCFNRIDLPLYTTKEDLSKYLTLAIQMEATGFGIE